MAHTEHIEVISPPLRSPIAGSAAFVSGLGILYFASQVVADPDIPTDFSIVLGLLCLCLSASFFEAGRRLLSHRGGLMHDRQSEQIGLGLTNPRDIFWLAHDQLTGIRVHRIDMLAGDEVVMTWTASLERQGQPPIVMAEGSTFGDIVTVARRLGTSLNIPVLEDQDIPQNDAPIDTTIRFSVSRRSALSRSLSLLGVNLSVVGIALILQVEAFPVFGLFFGPLMALTGLALLGVVIVKRLAVEELRHHDGHWEHCFTWANRRWSIRRYEAKDSHWRLRFMAIRGARLELVTPQGMLIMGSGATTRSTATITTLSQLPARFAKPPSPSVTPVPSPQDG